nr:hypothetical protein [Candidatus Shapirobacteria bacterium]
MKLFQKILIIIALLFGLFVRLYKINGPVADWHSFRQADTASVTRNFLERGIDLLHPTYHDLSNVQSGVDNPLGYRMVEFPIYNALTVVIYRPLHQFLPQLTLEEASRIINISFSIGSALLIYLICFRLTSEFWPSFLALSVFLFLPFNIYYSRVILPEPSAIFFMLLTLYLFPIFPIISAIPFALSILIKPYTAIIIFPLLVFFSIRKSYFLNLKSIFRLFIFSLLSLLPFYLWRNWITQFPEGIPKSDWLFFFDPNFRKTVWWHGYNISWIYPLVTFKPYWWRWLFYERLTQLILGAFGIIPFLLGFAYRKKNSQPFTILSFVGIFIYFAVVAGGNVRHDYYQSLTTPFISIILGFGLYYLTNFVFKSKIVVSLIALTIFCSAFAVSLE